MLNQNWIAKLKHSNYYIVLTKINAERIERELSKQFDLPSTDLSLLARSLNASFIKQQDYPIELIDRLYAKSFSTAENWSFARAIADRLTSNDVVFCPGEEIGIPLAKIYGSQRERPKIVSWLHRITGLRTRTVLKLFALNNSIDLFVVSNSINKEFLVSYLNLSPEQVLFLWHPIDTKYFDFRVGSKTRSSKPRAVVMSVGLEYRDYQLLAAATADLNVEVKIAGFSQFQSRTAKCLPKVMPKNMSNQKYSWSELIELYRQADLVIICLKENTAAAGVTVLLEAMCCKKPIICSRTQGIKDYLSDETAIVSVKPGDAGELRRAILYLLNNPKEAWQRAERAFQLAAQRHDLERQVEVLTKFVSTIE